MRTHDEMESAAPEIAKTRKAARAVNEAIRAALDADDKTRDPMNALVVWTELGRGLSGKLERQGADAGLLARLITQHSGSLDHGAAPIDLGGWAYRVPAERRLTREDAVRAFSRLERAIGDKLAEHWADGDGGAHVREDFLAVVRAWYPIGLEIFRSLPAARDATDAEIAAALAAWCDRYLPKDTSGPEDLGVRREGSRDHGARSAEVGRCC